jgi:hypothetical protein
MTFSFARRRCTSIAEIFQRAIHGAGLALEQERQEKEHVTTMARARAP